MTLLRHRIELNATEYTVFFHFSQKLDGLSVAQLRARLDVLDEQLEARLNLVGDVFQRRQEPILAAIRIKRMKEEEAKSEECSS